MTIDEHGHEADAAAPASDAPAGGAASAERDAAAYRELGRLDPRFAELVVRLGTPDPFHFPDGGRTAESNFAGMVMHILAQQIATRVALVLYDRLVAATGGTPTPESLLRLDVDQLKAIGTSHSKATYLRALAEAVASGGLDIERLDAVGDAEVEDSLTAITGIGPWSAEMFLIHQLHRADILPAGDLGIRTAVQRLDSLTAVPSIEEVRRRGAAWSPYRTYAAALLWRSLAPAVSG
ncbi:DNA-3-methyladenine glycosylase family protein [Herbiconiux solani]|uniref:DNA-3-methyladenine glycosylase family protein n=1 Tax=Herbiconiux solani TaxID=661329 RepID=UPI0008249910|nr:DNA-3-methyladenine glycosylase [Herbiconiux solani]